jgi:prepilin-type N-terminal cleavage/methylation domain-containing protein
MRRDNGFTIIELIVVLVLAGILSAVILPRFLGASAANAIAARDSLLAVIRAGQQAARGRSNVSISIDETTSEWVAVANAGATELRSVRFPKRAVTLETGSPASSPLNCAAGFDAALADFTLQFDAEGNVASFSNNGVVESISPAFNGVRLCINDTVAMSLCVTRAGYAHEGNCDD